MRKGLRRLLPAKQAHVTGTENICPGAERRGSGKRVRWIYCRVDSEEGDLYASPEAQPEEASKEPVLDSAGSGRTLLLYL